jgi:hypothetical protein
VEQDLDIQTGDCAFTAAPAPILVQEAHRRRAVYDPWGLELAGIGYNAFWKIGSFKMAGIWSKLAKFFKNSTLCQTAPPVVPKLGYSWRKVQSGAGQKVGKPGGLDKMKPFPLLTRDYLPNFPF